MYVVRQGHSKSVVLSMRLTKFCAKGKLCNDVSLLSLAIALRLKSPALRALVGQTQLQ